MGRNAVALRRNWSFGRKSAGAVEVSLDEQADRVGGARRVLVSSSGQPERAAIGRWVLKDPPSEVRFGRFRAKGSIG
jgi:hypothetical protein